MYFANMSPEIKSLIDRAGMVAKANGEMFRRKVGAAVVQSCLKSLDPGSRITRPG